MAPPVARRSASVVCCCCAHFCVETSSSADGTGRFRCKMKKVELRGERDGEDLGCKSNEEKHKDLTGDPAGNVISTIGEFDSMVVSCCCTQPSLDASSSSIKCLEDDEAEDDEMQELARELPQLKLGMSSSAADGNKEDDGKMMTLLLDQEYCSRLPDEVTHLRNGSRIPIKGIAHLRKKNHVEISSDASTSGDEAKAAFADSPIAEIVTRPPAHAIIDAVEVAHSTDPHAAVDVEVVAVEAAARAYDGVVLDQVVAEDIAELAGDGEDVDNIVTVRETVELVDVEVVAVEAVARGYDGVVLDQIVPEDIAELAGDGEDADNIVTVRETVDLGDDGDPIVLGVLSPAEYRYLVFNVLLDLPALGG